MIIMQVQMEKYVIHFYLLWGLIICTDVHMSSTAVTSAFPDKLFSAWLSKWGQSYGCGSMYE